MSTPTYLFPAKVGTMGGAVPMSCCDLISPCVIPLDPAAGNQAELTDAGIYVAASGTANPDLEAIANLTGTGILVRNGDANWALLDSIDGGTY